MMRSAATRRGVLARHGSREKGSGALLMPADGDLVKALWSSHTFLRLQNHFNLPKILGGKLWKNKLVFHMLAKKEAANYRIGVELQYGRKISYS